MKFFENIHIIITRCKYWICTYLRRIIKNSRFLIWNNYYVELKTHYECVIYQNKYNKRKYNGDAKYRNTKILDNIFLLIYCIDVIILLILHLNLFILYFTDNDFKINFLFKIPLTINFYPEIIPKFIFYFNNVFKLISTSKIKLIVKLSQIIPKLPPNYP